MAETKANDEKYLGAGKDKQSGETRATGEFILKAGSTYAVRVYSVAAIQAGLDLNWYEHTNK